MELSAQDVVVKALTKARVIYPGESISQAKYTAGYDELLGLLESWSIGLSTIKSDTEDTLSLVAGTAQYTYGVGGNLNASYPTQVLSSFIRSDSLDTPCKIIGVNQYNDIHDKTIQGTPYWLYLNPQYPLAYLNLFPTPDASDILHLIVTKQLISFNADGETKTDLAPAYGSAIITNLALLLCTSYGKKITPELSREAEMFLDRITMGNSLNRKSRMKSSLSCMLGQEPGFNIKSGLL